MYMNRHAPHVLSLFCHQSRETLQTWRCRQCVYYCPCSLPDREGSNAEQVLRVLFLSRSLVAVKKKRRYIHKLYCQRVGRLSMQEWCRGAIYAILKRKLYNFTTNTLKAYLCAQASSFIGFVISKTHISDQKPCGRQLNEKVCCSKVPFFSFFFLSC